MRKKRREWKKDTCENTYKKVDRSHHQGDMVVALASLLPLLTPKRWEKGRQSRDARVQVRTRSDTSSLV